ncbi:beta-ribofuranosylaminobenzene 5'-phosphate synthase [Candidatus Bathyarchaeota archaeon]|nr:beta-ribofuranosylaminobenzene 5'-phosphate synthase [Candidatus Bathyarchaeota archaeon]
METGGRVEVSVKTPSRLHICLIDMNGDLGRVDGSLGVAIDKPNVFLSASMSGEVEVTGDIEGRVEEMARRFLTKVKSGRGVSIQVKETIPAHVGFGSDTQLSLAVATSISKLLNLNLTVYELAKIMGRGGTSGIGVAAFDKGGLILDGGHSFGENKEKKDYLPSSASDAPPAKVLLRYDFPEDWCFIVATPKVESRIHGGLEREIFKRLCPIPAVEVGMITRIILMKLLPSIIERDIETFGSGLTELQDLGFAKAARNLMHPATRECIRMMLEGGVYGAGQSSFGPTAYGLIKKNEQTRTLEAELRDLLESFGGGEVYITGPNNKGAEVKVYNKT